MARRCRHNNIMHSDAICGILSRRTNIFHNSYHHSYLSRSLTSTTMPSVDGWNCLNAAHSFPVGSIERSSFPSSSSEVNIYKTIISVLSNKTTKNPMLLLLPSSSSDTSPAVWWIPPSIGTYHPIQQQQQQQFIPSPLSWMMTSSMLLSSLMTSLTSGGSSTSTSTATGTSSHVVLSWAIWFLKRTFQPSLLRKKRKSGYLKRSESVGGRKILRRRRAKGRARLFGA